MRLQEEELHLLLVDRGIVDVTDGIVVLDCLLIQIYDFSQLHPSLFDFEFLDDHALLETSWQDFLLLHLARWNLLHALGLLHSELLHICLVVVLQRVPES